MMAGQTESIEGVLRMDRFLGRRQLLWLFACLFGVIPSLLPAEIHATDPVHSIIDEHTGISLQCRGETAGSGRWLDQTLAHPLTADAAVSVALVASPEFQATLE